jgi:4-hydroxybenzoate polyprenyltransferase
VVEPGRHRDHAAAPCREDRPALLVAADATALPIPLVGAALAASTFVLLGVAPDVRMVALAASGAFLVYLLDRAWLSSPEDARNRPGREAWHRRHPAYRWVATGTAVVTGLMSMRGLPASVWIMGGILGLLAAGHLTPIAGTRLKASAAGKPLLIATAWGAGAVLVPISLGMHAGGTTVAALLLIRVLTLLANVFVTDIADIPGDREAGVDSLASALGEHRTRRLAVVLLGIAALLAASLVVSLESWLWAVEGSGLLVFAFVIRPSDRPIPDSLKVDLLVGWPAITVGVWLATGIG